MNVHPSFRYYTMKLIHYTKMKKDGLYRVIGSKNFFQYTIQFKGIEYKYHGIPKRTSLIRKFTLLTWSTTSKLIHNVLRTRNTPFHVISDLNELVRITKAKIYELQKEDLPMYLNENLTPNFENVLRNP